MKKWIGLLVLIVLAMIVAGWSWNEDSAQAGVTGAHFVGNPSVSVDGRTVTASGKVAGLGNVEQIHVELTATAECINGGGNHPKASNKTSITAAGDFPVQNGKALFSLSGTAVFDPDPAGACGTVRISDVHLTVTAPGVFLEA